MPADLFHHIELDLIRSLLWDEGQRHRSGRGRRRRRGLWRRGNSGRCRLRPRGRGILQRQADGVKDLYILSPGDLDDQGIGPGRDLREVLK